MSNMLKIKIQRGFTLVEMLVAMAIFVMFTGVIINSYASIVQSQKQANEFRIVYADARNVFETLVGELRNGMVDYKDISQNLTAGNAGLTELHLVSKDAATKTKIVFKKNDPLPENNGVFIDEIKLNNNVNIVDFKMYVSPVIDPYDPQFVANDKNQFQPKVTIYAEFGDEKGDEKNVKLQTTISSRIYNQVY